MSSEFGEGKSENSPPVVSNSQLPLLNFCLTNHDHGIHKSSGALYDPYVIEAFFKAEDELLKYIGKIRFDVMNHD
jgi:hypothetical protein